MRFKDIIKEVMTKREPLRSEPKCESPVGVVHQFNIDGVYKGIKRIRDHKDKINHE